MWGFCGHPLMYKDLVICIVGGEGSVAVAFDKDTGKEKWKNLTAREQGYSPPTLITSGGKDQVVIWHAQALNGLDPLTGKELWSVGLEPMYGMSIMAPRQHGDKLFAAGIGGAGVVLKLDGDKVTPVWQESTAKEKGFAPKPRGLYPVNMTPFIENGIIYGVDQPGMLRAVELDTGKKLWFNFKPVIGKEEEEDFKNAGSGTAFIVKNGDRYLPVRRDRRPHHREADAEGLRGSEPGESRRTRRARPSTAKSSGATRPSPTSAPSSATTRRSSA